MDTRWSQSQASSANVAETDVLEPQEAMHTHEEKKLACTSEGRTEYSACDGDLSTQIVRDALAAIAATDSEETSLGGDPSCAVRSFGNWQQWEDFCSRVESCKAWPSCVIDFPYQDKGHQDKGHLNLIGDERLVEHMYCFHDPQIGSPEQKIVVIHSHTVMTWGERLAAPHPVVIC
jgi:hypothetical protein